MYTTKEENGLLNNYAVEPQITYSESPTSNEQRRYLIQGIVAALVITATIVTAFAVS